MTHVPFPQVFGHRGTKVRGAGVQNPRREAQQTSRLEMPISGFLLHFIGLRSHAIFLHRALQPVELTVLEMRGAHQLDVIEHEIGHLPLAYHPRHVLHRP